jgi:hypothetical protein
MTGPGLDQPPPPPPATERPLHGSLEVHHTTRRPTPTGRRPRHATPLVAPFLAALLAAGSVAACGGTAGAFGSSPAAARANADDFLTALALRFGPLRRDSVLSANRPRYVRATLTPSRIWDEPSIWSSRTDSTRTIAVRGAVIDGQYVLAQQPSVDAPRVPGESRHLIHLRRLDDDEFEWRSSGEIAIGAVRAAEVQGVMHAIAGAAEHRGESALRAEVRARLPRAARAAGQLFRIDTLRATPFADGTTQHFVSISVHSAGVRDAYPAFADYLDKYTAPSSYHITLQDRGGTPWIVLTARDEVLTLRMRTRDGRLAPLHGPPRARPDTMVLDIDVETKVSLFEVGLKDLRAEMTYVDGPREIGWRMRFHRRPKWELPLVAERLLRTPLERPFRGDGVLNYFYVRDADAAGGGSSIIGRDFRIAVEESAVLRFMNRISSSAMRDVTRDVERERDAFVAEVLYALRDDLVAGLSGAGVSADR